MCCRYVALPIDRPRTRRDFDDIRWYLMHEGVSVFIEEGNWYAQFLLKCNNLLPDRRCAIYERRPAICREYKAGECDYLAGDYEYEALFTDASQLERYAAEYLRKHPSTGKSSRPARRPRRRRPTPASAHSQALVQIGW